MTVRERLKRGDSSLYRTRPRRRHYPPARRDEARGAPAHAEVRGFYEGGPPLDHALYTCQCGFTFEASVSTSVDCPHCGSAQAW